VMSAFTTMKVIIGGSLASKQLPWIWRQPSRCPFQVQSNVTWHDMCPNMSKQKMTSIHGAPVEKWRHKHYCRRHWKFLSG
jgi:hypothetical protein